MCEVGPFFPSHPRDPNLDKNLDKELGQILSRVFPESKFPSSLAELGQVALQEENT